MNSRKWRIGGAAALALLWLSMLLLGTGPADSRVLALLYAGERPWLLAAARFVTGLGEPSIVIGIGLVASAWLLWRHQARYALAVVLVTLLGRGLTELVKYLVDRPRPAEVVRLVVTHSQSFPSGHATTSMIVCLTLALVLTPAGQWRRAAVVAALFLSFLIGLSRVMLGAHWPSDVVGGWAFGAAWVILVLPLTTRLARLRGGGAPLRR